MPAMPCMYSRTVAGGNGSCRPNRASRDSMAMRLSSRALAQWACNREGRVKQRQSHPIHAYIRQCVLQSCWPCHYRGTTHLLRSQRLPVLLLQLPVNPYTKAAHLHLKPSRQQRLQLCLHVPRLDRTCVHAGTNQSAGQQQTCSPVQRNWESPIFAVGSRRGATAIIPGSQ